MAKKRYKPARRVKNQRVGNAAKQPARTPDLSRRRLLNWTLNGLISLPIVAGAGYFTVRSVQASIVEGDLTRIGQGVPAVVQIHDPTCMICQALQRDTRAALEHFAPEAITYLVANIRTEKGRAFAAQYGVPHVTLLLFDGDGEMVEVVRGRSDANTLRGVFARHLRGGTS